MISKCEVQDGVPPAVTTVASEIAQNCRVERTFDCLEKREVDIARELLSRNRSRDARRRAELLVQEFNLDPDWSNDYRGLRLGDKLIALAVRFAKING